MRRQIGGMALACALLGVLARPGLAQYQEVPPTLFTGPLSHPRYEDGGLWLALESLYWKTNNPIKNQPVGFRGFIDEDGSIQGIPGRWVGSHHPALYTDSLGPGTYQLGWDLTVGWRFENGVSVGLAWYHLYDVKRSAVASTLPFNNGIVLDPNLAETFVSAPVFNFPPEFAGNDQNLNVGNAGATYGIWNAATSMQIEFVQRFDMFDINGRVPMWQTDTFRSYGLCGPRIVALWERFKWRTVDSDPTGGAGPDTVAIYSNIVSNRLYGVHVGGGWEWFLGQNPLGGWSISLEAQASLSFDFAKGRARYEREDDIGAATRSRNLATLVPGVEAKLGLWWYPWEAIQVHVGYDLFAWFNTISSPEPIDFNFGSINPRWDAGQLRYYYGLSIGIGFVF